MIPTTSPSHAAIFSEVRRFTHRDLLAMERAGIIQEKVYADHPRPTDVFLLIEVSDSTLRKDRAVKLPLHAAVGIPELWIVNLVDKQIEIYTEPHENEYRTRTTKPLTGRFAPHYFPDDVYQWLPEAILDLLTS